MRSAGVKRIEGPEGGLRYREEGPRGENAAILGSQGRPRKSDSGVLLGRRGLEAQGPSEAGVVVPGGLQGEGGRRRCQLR